MGLWEKEIGKNPKNADAWYNYYRANRNAYIKGEEGDSQKAKGISRFDRLKNIIEGMEKNVYDYLVKSDWEPDDIVALIRKRLKKIKQ